MTTHETFWTLFFDPAHWMFELFLMGLFDGVLGVLLVPYLKRRLKRWSKHHQSDDQQIEQLQRQVKQLQAHLGINNIEENKS